MANVWKEVLEYGVTLNEPDPEASCTQWLYEALGIARTQSEANFLVGNEVFELHSDRIYGLGEVCTTGKCFYHHRS